MNRHPLSHQSSLGHYRTLSPLAGIHVSPLQLGAMSIGDNFKLPDAYFDSGGNFIDTANNYQGESSESFIGEWAKKRGIRDQLVIADKRGNDAFAQKVNYIGNNIKSMHISVEASLKKLRTTYIDILYIHWWDWDTGVEEVMNGLHNLVGVSDTPAWVVAQANQYARDHGKLPFVIYQGACQWNVMERSFEREIIPMARAHSLALAPFNVLAGRKLRTDAEGQQRRESGEKGRTLFGPNWERSVDEKKISHVPEKVAGEVGAKSLQLPYVMHMKVPYVFPVIGGRKVEHLLSNTEALDIALSSEQITYLESILPFNPGFPNIMIARAMRVCPFVVDGDGAQPSALLASAARFDKNVHLQPIRPSPKN
ncbi:Aldo/keto reductase [Mycena rebaudengoi]|nr:Aldo/keto reductase [Mycena rebaudengoi]